MTALGCEVAFRILHVPIGTLQINRATIVRSANSRLLFELRPGASVQAEVRYEVNGLGLRGPEVAEAKPPGVMRIAVVGDSIAFGYWIEEKDAFPRVLEGLLGGPGQVQVLNFGVPGYNLAQDVEMVRSRVLALAPDIVVVGVCLNDLEGPMSYEYGLTVDRSARRRRLSGRAYEELAARSRLLSWIEYRLMELEVRQAYVKARQSGPLYAEGSERQAEALRAHFAGLVALLEPRRIPVLIAVFPAFGKTFEAYPYRDLHRAIVATAEASGLAAVDLLDCFRAYRFRDVRVDVVHPNPAGHRIAAHALRDALCARGLACGSAPPLDRTCRGYRPADFPSVRGY